MSMEQCVEEFDAALLDPGAEAYAAWAQEGLWVLTRGCEGYLGNSINLLWAPVDEIAPQAVTTREEAAALIYSILSHLDILPV